MSTVQARNIGIAVQYPRRQCRDKHCPYHGDLRVRGIILTGRVYKKLMQNAVVIERVTAHYVRKYKRYMRRKSRMPVHLPPCIQVEVGDRVKIAECRPISKTISFVVIENLGGGGRGVKEV